VPTVAAPDKEGYCLYIDAPVAMRLAVIKSAHEGA